MATMNIKGLSVDAMWGWGGTPDHFQLFCSQIHNPADLVFTATKVTAIESTAGYSPASAGSTFVWDIGGSFTQAGDGTISGTVTSLVLSDLGPSGTGTKVQLMNMAGLNTTYATLLDIVKGRVSPSVLLAGNDTLTATGFVANPAFPGQGADLYGEAGNDTLIGTAYNDTLAGGLGNDTMTGGLGNDTYKIDSTLDVVNELASQGTDTVKSEISYTLGANLENLNLITFRHVNGTGNELNNNIKAGAGNNVLSGMAGNDNLQGFAGNDVLNGGAGNDILNGGAGIDWAYYNTATAGVTVNLTLATAQATGGAGSDTLSGVENLLGSNFNDVLTGTTLANTLNGGGGADTLNGGAGNDVLIGGAGKDALTGGLGADRFVFNAVGETGIVNTAWDVISDFKISELDKIDLSAIDANGALAGNQAFSFIGTAAFNVTNATGQLRFDAVAKVLYGSTDVDNAAEFAIALTGVTALAATDFVL